MKILFNGNEADVGESTMLFTLLQDKKIAIEYAIVEFNGSVLTSQEIKTISLKERDCLEVMALVGGG